MFRKGLISLVFANFNGKFWARTMKLRTPPPAGPSQQRIPALILQNKVLEVKRKENREEEEVKMPRKLLRNTHLRDAAMEEIKREMYPRPEYQFVYLPQTQNFEEIILYFQKFKKILKDPQYLILMSRLAHLKDIKDHNLDPRLFELIRKVCDLKLRTSPKYIANFIKYAAMIGIHDKIFWRKMISELYKADFSKNLTEFCLTLNYLQVHGVLNRSLLVFIQEKAVQILDQNVDNQSYKIMELILNSLKNFKINEDLLRAVLRRLRLHLHTLPLKNLRNSFIPAVQMKLEDEDLWDLYRKWIGLRIGNLIKKEAWEEINENYSYLLFTYAKAIDEGLIKGLREKFEGDEYKPLKSLFLEIFEKRRESLFYESNEGHFLRVFKGFSLLAVNYPNQEYLAKLEYLMSFLTKHEELQDKLKIKDYFEVFLMIVRMNELYRPLEKHPRLLDLIDGRLVKKSFEMPIKHVKKICDFFFEERGKGGSVDGFLLSLRNGLVSIVILRGVHNDEDRITVESMTESFKNAGLIDAESIDSIHKGLKTGQDS